MKMKRLPVLLLTAVATAALVPVGATSPVPTAVAPAERPAAVVVPAQAMPAVAVPGLAVRPDVAAQPDRPAQTARPAGPVQPAQPAQPAARPARPASAKAPGTPCAATARACIDLAHNKAWLISGGVVEYGPVPITSGRKGYRTPAGTFRVFYKDIDHYSSLFDNAPMPYSVFFNGGVAFHQGSLKVLSHGCIHLSRTAAKRFFAELARGDVVQAVR